ncbi:MAG: TIGR03118 family protein [Proteobacteria bacterium]|nr:TIGR03118 family protein [Pseudomonadota bacterium]
MRLLVGVLVALGFAPQALALGKLPGNAYEAHTLLASNAELGADKLEPALKNAWGLTVKKDVAGTRMLVGVVGGVYRYLGDVTTSQDVQTQVLGTDAFRKIDVPAGGQDRIVSTITASSSKEQFVSTYTLPGGAAFTTTANLLFAGTGGVISAWAERRSGDSRFDFPAAAVPVIDHSAAGAQYFSMALNVAQDRLYATNFGKAPGIQVFDGQFQPVWMEFDQPFDYDNNGGITPGELAPYSLLSYRLPNGEPRLLVGFAKTKRCDDWFKAKLLCKDGEMVPGRIDDKDAYLGAIAEFTEDGKVVTTWRDTGVELKGPSSMVFAPAGFGALAGALLVSNFVSGSIAAFDPKTRAFIDYLRDADGEVLRVEKPRGLVFGDGVTAGGDNTLYVVSAAGEQWDGMLVRITPTTPADKAH